MGIEGVNSNLATALRTIVFLILSGLATGASWLCYFKALQIGDASKVVPVGLGRWWLILIGTDSRRLHIRTYSGLRDPRVP